MKLKQHAIQILDPFFKGGIADIRNRHIIHAFMPPIPSYPALKTLSSIFKRTILQQDVLTKVAIGLTNACQCRCLHCFYAKYETPDRKELQTERIKNIIDDAVSMGAYFIYLEGGEPLLHQDLLNLVNYIQKRKVMPIILTNGLEITPHFIDKIKKKELLEINVSIDSSRREIHDTYRRLKGCFTKAIEGIKLCVEAGLVTGINTYVTQKNIWNGDLEEIIQLGYSLRVDKVRIIDVIPSGELLNQESVLLTNKDRMEVQRLIEKYQDRKPPIVFRYKKVENTCEAAHQCLHITPYGDVLPCGFMPIKFGNVVDEPLPKIWKRMLKSPIGSTKVKYCWMQDYTFRRKYITPFSKKKKVPYNAEKIKLVSKKQS